MKLSQTRASRVQAIFEGHSFHPSCFHFVDINSVLGMLEGRLAAEACSSSIENLTLKDSLNSSHGLLQASNLCRKAKRIPSALGGFIQRVEQGLHLCASGNYPRLLLLLRLPFNLLRPPVFGGAWTSYSCCCFFYTAFFTGGQSNMGVRNSQPKLRAWIS